MKTHYRWFLIGSIFYLGPLFLMWQYIQRQYASAPLQTVVNVLDYGAAGDAVTDDGDAFAQAFAYADKNNLPIIIPKKNYVINQPLTIRSGMVIRSDGAVLQQTKGNGPVLLAHDVHEWVIQGPLTLSGTRTAAKLQDHDMETGLWISGCSHYMVDKVTVRNFSGKGIDIKTGELSGINRGDHGQFAFISFINNGIGLEIDPGVGAEYDLFTLALFSGNDIATHIATGNTIISTANIVDNENGIELSGGPNHGHGIFNAININHNKGFNIRSEAITNGYTFNACHIYGDSATSGIVHLTHSSGLHFTGGMLDVAMVNDGDGLNMLADDFTGSAFTVTGNNAAGLHTQCLFGKDKETCKTVP